MGSPFRPLPRTARAACAAVVLLSALSTASFVVGDGAIARWAKGPVWWAALLAVAACLWRRALGLRGAERIGWGALAFGSTAWVLGDVYYMAAGVDSVPTLADAGYLAFCPAAFAGLVVLLRAQLRGAPATLWVDGLAAALAAAAASAAVVLQAVLATVGGTAAEVAVNLAYPLSDLLLLGVVVTAAVLQGWRLDATWRLLGGGVVIFLLADSTYLVTVAGGSYSSPSPLDYGWYVGFLLLLVASWQPARPRTVAPGEGVRTAAAPLAFALAGLGLLVVGAVAELNLVAIGLAAASLLAVFGRLLMTLSAHAALVRSSREEAVTDALTGLGNRRALAAELERRLAAGAPCSLVLFDLDGFKNYNDSFGHPAGDALLVRIGQRLRDHLGRSGTAFRMGGDEFCAILDGADAKGAGARASAAMAEQGEGFAIGASWGAIVLPGEASTASDALRLADQRMYARKTSGRVPADRQTTAALLTALTARHPELGDHLDGTASLAAAVAVELGLDAATVGSIQQAAALHDIGKVAIPDAILGKPGPLTEEEWEFVRLSPGTGERIVAAAPALDGAAALVRSSHERWDGAGHPDGLAGEDVPFGARVIAVCDAYDAMVSDRPYRAGMDPAAARAELRRCAGSQFDPQVVEAFLAVQGRPAAMTAEALRA